MGLVPALVVTLILLAGIASTASTRSETSPKSYTKEYGEPCNLIEKCNYRHWLKCSGSGGICECSHPDQMLFLKTSSKFFSFFTSRATLMEKKSCRARVHESCRREKFLDDDNNLIPAPPLTRPQPLSIPKQTQLCVDNAYCHAHGLCRCGLNYAVDPNDGTCRKYGEYSQACERDAECHPDHFLKCRRGICLCDPLLRYDRLINKCTAGPGDKCVLSLNRSGKLINNCIANGTCHLGECKCMRGYVPDYNMRICARDYNYYCDESQPCVAFFSTNGGFIKELVCTNSSCVCNQTPVPAVYDKHSKRCLKLRSVGRIVTPPVSAFKLMLTFLASMLL